jgi:hypothetical protein
VQSDSAAAWALSNFSIKGSIYLIWQDYQQGPGSSNIMKLVAVWNCYFASMTAICPRMVRRGLSASVESTFRLFPVSCCPACLDLCFIFLSFVASSFVFLAVTVTSTTCVVSLCNMVRCGPLSDGRLSVFHPGCRPLCAGVPSQAQPSRVKLTRKHQSARNPLKS